MMVCIIFFHFNFIHLREDAPFCKRSREEGERERTERREVIGESRETVI